MKIIPWANLENLFSPAAITIGVFDGIHIGHKMLFDEVISKKQSDGYAAGIVTFTDSIFTLFKQSEKPLLSIEERLERFESLGFDFVVLIDFTEKIARIPGTDFLETLKKKCGLKYLVEGEDFRFGDGGKTGMAEIKSFCDKNGIEVKFIPPVMYGDERVSSSLIREMIKSGKADDAKKLMR